MSNIQDIISQSLVYYDKSQPVIKYLYNNTFRLNNNINSNYRRIIFEFYDRITRELVVSTEVELLGMYYNKYKICEWAWANPGLRISENYLSKEILRWALSLDIDMTTIKSILITSRDEIKDNIQIDINVALGASILKQPYIYTYNYYINGFNLVYYFVLLNQKDLDILSDKIAKGEIFVDFDEDNIDEDIKKELKENDASYTTKP